MDYIRILFSTFHCIKFYFDLILPQIQKKSMKLPFILYADKRNKSNNKRSIAGRRMLTYHGYTYLRTHALYEQKCVCGFKSYEC